MLLVISIDLLESELVADFLHRCAEAVKDGQ